MNCQIPKKRRLPTRKTTSCHIRIGTEQYQDIINICDETGRSIADVSTRLLEYALERVEIVDEDAKPT